MAKLKVTPKSQAPEDFFVEVFRHTQIAFDDYAEAWYCVSCYREGAGPELAGDIPCIPRDMPDDWHRTYG